MTRRLRNYAWDGRYLLGGLFDAVKWPFERVFWAVERGVVWPLGERGARAGLPLQAMALGALALLAAGALAVGLTRSSGGDEAPTVAAIPAADPVPPATPTPTVEPREPVLEGATPDFTPAEAKPAAKAAKAAAVDDGDPETASSAAPRADAADASSSSAKAVDPGPAAIEVAERFSGAFVLYETGRSDAKVRTTLGETASPELAKALLRRPPRLPANVKVPKAKVLNVVPGPRHGSTFTLSASLLRVGVTSELRIDLQREKESGQWRVTDVLG